MITVPEVILARVTAALGETSLDNASVADEKVIAATGFSRRRVVAPGTTLFDLSLAAARDLVAANGTDLGAVVVASFTESERFPTLSTRLVGALGLAPTTLALDLQAACSAYPYALYVASAIARDTGRPTLLIDGDVQSPFVSELDAATAPLFSDAATATWVLPPRRDQTASSYFDFLTIPGDALACSATGPIRMAGFAVFSFVARETTKFLKAFREAALEAEGVDWFVPHQANLYMVRQLAKAVGMEEKLLLAGGEYANAGSASCAIALARAGKPGRAWLAGYGAGLSAATACVRLADDFVGRFVPVRTSSVKESIK